MTTVMSAESASTAKTSSYVVYAVDAFRILGTLSEKTNDKMSASSNYALALREEQAWTGPMSPAQEEAFRVMYLRNRIKDRNPGDEQPEPKPKEQ